MKQKCGTTNSCRVHSTDYNYITQRQGPRAASAVHEPRGLHTGASHPARPGPAVTPSALRNGSRLLTGRVRSVVRIENS